MIKIQVTLKKTMNQECLCVVELWSLGQLQGKGGAREAVSGGDWTNEIFLFYSEMGEQKGGVCEKLSFMGAKPKKLYVCKINETKLITRRVHLHFVLKVIYLFIFVEHRYANIQEGTLLLIIVV